MLLYLCNTSRSPRITSPFAIQAIRRYRPEGAPGASERPVSTENGCPQQSRSRGEYAAASTAFLAGPYVRSRAVISTRYGTALDHESAHKCFKAEIQGPASREARDAIMKDGKESAL